jgi:hypothetical protein
MTRKETLETAIAAVCQNREQDYGSPEDNFKLIADLWRVYLTARKNHINSDDVAVLMILLKVARVASGHGKDDNWIDIAGYAACGAELSSLKNS